MLVGLDGFGFGVVFDPSNEESRQTSGYPVPNAEIQVHLTKTKSKQIVL